MKKRYIQSVCVAISFILLLLVVDPVSATTISDIQNDINKNQSQLNNVNQQIAGYKGAQADIGEEIEELDAEMVSLLTDINLIKEAIEDKEEDIARTQVEYDQAVVVKDEQYESMKIRIQFMYEKGDTSYLQMFFGATSMADMMNKASYVEELYEYDRRLLEEYEDIVQQVAQLQDRLEEEKSELVTSQTELEEEQAYVEEVLEKKQEEYENYSVMLAKARQEAAAYTARIKQETAQIRKLEEEERKRREEEERKRKEEEERKRKEEEERRKAEQEKLLAEQKTAESDEDSESHSDEEEDEKEESASNKDSDDDSGSKDKEEQTSKPASSNGGKGHAALAGEPPMLIDEWQTVPKLWDAVRYTVDHRRLPGQFILTGSAVPDKKAEGEIEHSGTGRFAWLTMRPMSLYESGESNGGVGLEELFSAPDKILVENRLSLNDIAFLMCRGGWPMAVDMPRETALEQAFDYYDAVTKEDVTTVDGVKRLSVRVQRLMRAYARHQGTQASIGTLKQDLINNETETLSEDTISSYIDALRKIFVIEDMPAWNPNLRSKAAIRTTDTRYFVDPSIGTASLGLGPADLINDLNTMGFLFETLCVRDLRVYAQVLNGEVYHFRDKSGLECDAVIHLRNGNYGLVEIKLGGETLINEGASTLNTLTERLNDSPMKPPAFRMILTATGEYAYRRPSDGIYVVPVGCLKY